MMGNDAIGYGALVAGCRFMAGYPITPATDVLEWMAKHAPRYGGIVVQAEDELAAINMTIGAAYAGVRAMTATSGPGQALMTEGIGLAGVVETPIVVIECARAGPLNGHAHEDRAEQPQPYYLLGPWRDPQGRHRTRYG